MELTEPFETKAERMKPLTGLLFSAVLSAAIVVNVGRNDPTAADSAANSGSTDGDVVVVEESMHEFMEYVFQPTYRRLKQSMAAAPADNAGWKAIKADSLTLAESCNLLFSRKPDEQGADWVQHAIASRTHGAELYKAAKTKDFDGATTSYKAMLESCNACHRQFENGKHILQP